MSDDENYDFGRGDNDMEYLYQDNIDYQYGNNDIFDEDGKMIELGVKEYRESQDPVQKFTSFVRSVAKTMSSDGYIKVTTQDIQFIVSQIDKVPNQQYKNPTGFVIGYWLVSSKTAYKDINKKRYNAIKQNIKNIEYPLEEKDLIRYARFWLSHDLLPELE